VRSSRVDEARLNFTCLTAKAKFSGARNGPDKGEMAVIPFLESMTRGQNSMGLSQEEFLNILISSTTGGAHTMVVELGKRHGEGQMTIPQIYLRLTDAYFFDLSPEAAKAKLNALSQKRHSFANLSEADWYIRKWVKLAVMNSRDETHRKFLSELWYKDYLSKILPRDFAPNILQQKKTLESLNCREVTSVELFGICRSYRFEIDALLLQTSRNAEKGNASKAKAKAAKAQSAAASASSESTGSVNQVTTRSQSSGQNTGASGSGGNSSQSKSQKKKNKGKDSGKSQSKEKDKKNGPPDPKSVKHCLLCMHHGHKTHACIVFTTEAERELAPSVCTLCPFQAFHMRRFCPVARSKN